MIDYNKFKDVLHKAEKVLGYLGEEQRKVYWENVKGFPEDTVTCAVDRLIKTHGFYKFPTVAEFLDAISDHFRVTDIQPYLPPCETCNGVGRFVAEYWEGDGTYYKEVFCDCDEGMRQRRLRAEYWERISGGLTKGSDKTIGKKEAQGA